MAANIERYLLKEWCGRYFRLVDIVDDAIAPLIVYFAHRRGRLPQAQQTHILVECDLLAIGNPCVVRRGGRQLGSGRSYKFLSVWTVAKTLLRRGATRVAIQDGAHVWLENQTDRLQVTWHDFPKPPSLMFPGTYRRVVERAVVDPRLAALDERPSATPPVERKDGVEPKGGVKLTVGPGSLARKPQHGPLMVWDGGDSSGTDGESAEPPDRDDVAAVAPAVPDKRPVEPPDRDDAAAVAPAVPDERLMRAGRGANTVVIQRREFVQLYKVVARTRTLTGWSLTCSRCGYTRDCNGKRALGEQETIRRLLAWETLCDGDRESHRVVGGRVLLSEMAL